MPSRSLLFKPCYLIIRARRKAGTCRTVLKTRNNGFSRQKRGLCMKFVAFLSALTIALATGALAQPVIPEKAGDVLVKVGDHEITRQMLDSIIATIPEENRVPFLTPDGRKKILDEVVAFTLFAEAAKAQGMDREPASKTRLDYAQTEY